MDVFLTGNTSSLGECSCGHTFLPLQVIIYNTIDTFLSCNIWMIPDNQCFIVMGIFKS